MSDTSSNQRPSDYLFRPRGSGSGTPSPGNGNAPGNGRRPTSGVRRDDRVGSGTHHLPATPATDTFGRPDLYDYLRLRLSFQDDDFDRVQTDEFWDGLDDAGRQSFLDEAQAHDEPDAYAAAREVQDRSLERPKAIANVREYHVHNPGEPEHWILKHPTRQQLMRLSPEAYFLWKRFDGEHTVRDLLFEYLNVHGAVAPETVLSIIDQAYEREFIEPPGHDVYKEVGQSYAGAQLRFAQKLRQFFSTKWSIPHFDAIVGSVYRFGGFLVFNPVVYFLAIPLIFYGLGEWIRNMGNADKFNLFRTNESLILGLLTYVVIKIVVGVLHEFGQACYLKSLGREVPEGGIIWYYGIPYVVHNSNDVWLEPRPRRLLHSAIGPGIELVIGSLAFLLLANADAWGVTQDPLARDILFKVGMLACFGALFKLNPLIELNGYFMLVDIVRIPRLMRLSFYFWIYEIWGKLLKREPFTRIERTYFLYGVLCILWMIAFYWLVVVIVAQKHLPKLIEELDAADAGGLLAYIGVVLLILAPGGLSAWSYIVVWWHVFYDGTMRFFRYTSQNIVSYSLAAGAFAAPFLLQLIPVVDIPVPGGDPRADNLYRVAARTLALLGMALAVPFAVFLRRNWVDQRTAPFIKWLGASAVFFSIPQAMYWWSITGSGNPQFWWHLGSTFDMLGAACLVPGTRSLVGLLKTYELGPWARRIFLAREAVPAIVGFVLFFALGKAAMVWRQAAGVPVDPWYMYLAFMWTVALTLLGYVLIILWIHTSTLLFSGSFLPWAGFAVSLSLLAISLLLSSIDAAVHVDNFLARQQYALHAGAGLILASAMLVMIVFRVQVRFRIYSQDDRTQLGEADQLRQVMSKLVWSLLRNVEAWFGQQRRNALRRAFEARCRGNVKIAAGELWDPLSKDVELARLAKRMRTLFHRITNTFIEEFGPGLYQRALVNLHDGLFWRERELAHQHIFRSDNWGVTLRHFEDPDLTPERKAGIFRQIPLFSDFDDEELEALMTRFREEEFAANEVVFRPGDESDRMYVILSGYVSVEHDVDMPSAGGLRPLAELRRGDWFGEISLIKEATRTASVVCLEPTTMLSLDRQTYLALADNYHAIGRKIEEAFEFLELLDEMPIFRELTTQRIRELATSMRLVPVRAGEVVIRQGAPGKSFYIVRHGTFDVVIHRSYADERRVAELIRGDYFGEIALLEDIPRTASVVAREDGEVLELKREDFERLLGKYVAMTSRAERAANRRHFESRTRRTGTRRQRDEETAAIESRATTVMRTRHRLVDRTTRRVARRSLSNRLIAVTGDTDPFIDQRDIRDDDE